MFWKQFKMRKFNLYYSLGIFSRQQTDIFLLFFPEKQVLKCQNLFSERSKKIFQYNFVCLNFYRECYALIPLGKNYICFIII